MIPKKRPGKLRSQIQFRCTDELERLKKEAEKSLNLDFPEWARLVLEQALKSLLEQ